MNILVTLIRIGLGSLFLYAGSAKLFKFEEFGATIVQLFSVSQTGGILLGLLLAAAECVIGAVMLIGYQIRIVSGMICLMMIGFTLVYFPALFDPASEVVCGCFGEQSRVDPIFFVRNTVIFAAAVFVRNRRDHRWSVDGLLRQR